MIMAKIEKLVNCKNLIRLSISQINFIKDLVGEKLNFKA